VFFYIWEAFYSRGSQNVNVRPFTKAMMHLWFRSIAIDVCQARLSKSRSNLLTLMNLLRGGPTSEIFAYQLPIFIGNAGEISLCQNRVQGAEIVQARILPTFHAKSVGKTIGT